MRALRALLDGEPGKARAELGTAARRPLLDAALGGYLDGAGDGRVYDRPAAFRAFIRGGGNVRLYDAVSAALVQRYRRFDVRSLVDIGCGDGRALVPALAASGRTPAVTLVEPSPLLAEARNALRDYGGTVTACATDATSFTTGPIGDFDLAQSTFALHALPPAEREAMLTALHGHVRHLVLAEFDWPAHPPGSTEHLTFLADSYEQGLAEYDADRDLVAQGFLMPVLTGQLTPGATRSTWEQPAAAWADQLARCGYRDIVVEPLCGYWSSPAFVLTAGT